MNFNFSEKVIAVAIGICILPILFSLPTFAGTQTEIKGATHAEQAVNCRIYWWLCR